jgi:poly-gamma-glutamate synthesis protein (capsule biosynthesis protein)
VELAESAHGPIPRAVPFDYVWGEALAELERFRPDARIANLETSITVSDTPWPGKGIHYRMHPANVGCLAAAGFDCCVLANNHVLDWGATGLLETIAALKSAKIATAGAGENASAAAAPAGVAVPGIGRVLVFAFGAATSGIPPSWAALGDRPGIAYLDELSAETAKQAARRIASFRRPGDIVVVSVHWGDNWGYGVPADQREFAHALVDEGAADIVHGHSSHHAKAIEVYRGRPLIYGCGDFLNDYEGISGYEGYRGDLPMMYFATIVQGGGLDALHIVPLHLERFRLTRATRSDAEWLAGTLSHEGQAFGTAARVAEDGRIELLWRRSG